MAKLRLQAGCCLLKLAQNPVYDEAIGLHHFHTLALLMNVTNLSLLPHRVMLNRRKKGRKLFQNNFRISFFHIYFIFCVKVVEMSIHIPDYL